MNKDTIIKMESVEVVNSSEMEPMVCFSDITIDELNKCGADVIYYEKPNTPDVAGFIMCPDRFKRTRYKVARIKAAKLLKEFPELADNRSGRTFDDVLQLMTKIIEERV